MTSAVPPGEGQLRPRRHVGDGRGAAVRRDGQRGGVGTRAAVLAFALAMLAATAVYAADLAEPVNVACFSLVGVSTAAALVVGPRLHRSPERGPWELLAAACVLFAVGGAARPAAVATGGPLLGLPDAFVLPGYVVTVVALVGLLRRRGAASDVHALADGTIVVLGAGLLAATFLAVPAAMIEGRPLWLSATSALYPVLDVLLLLLLLQLAFTTRRLTPSLGCLAVAMLCLMVGDLAYAVIGRQGMLAGPHLIDLPFLLAYTFLGAAALDPSMARITAERPRVVQAWSAGRLALLAPALLVPAGLLLGPTEPLPTRAIHALGVTAMIAALLVRSVGAVRGYARSRRIFEHQATHDALTDLPNRSLLLERLGQLLVARPSRRVDVLFLDLDGFKLVNDSWGHAVGDELLLRVAQRLATRLPPGTVLARVGGDEFVLAVPVDPAGIDGTTVADGIVTSLSQPFRLSVAEVVVTPSIGISTSAQPSATPENLIRDADTAMYRAKAAGRACHVVFDASMRESVRSRVETELALRHALGRGQLDVHYQPIVDLKWGRTVGQEALLRWHHPVLGAVAPVEFIGLAEETGMITDLGGFVLDRALADLARWRTRPASSGWTVAVNVSGRQLRDPAFRPSVTALLARHGLPGGALRLEITESAMIEDSTSVADNLVALHDEGVRFSVDDFGTGYSSLSYLRRFPVDEVKIDRSFVIGLPGREDDEEIVRAATAMAHALGLTVVAEGVETEAQRGVLARLGVDRAQGWLFGRPGPVPVPGGAPGARGSATATARPQRGSSARSPAATRPRGSAPVSGVAAAGTGASNDQ